MLCYRTIMLGALCLLVIGVLSVRSELSWDIAVTTGTQFELYKNSRKVYNGGDQFRDLTALIYDPVHDMLVFVDRYGGNASILTYHLTTKRQEILVKSTPNVNIHGLAFDPVKKTLFWTDTIKRSIHQKSLEPGSSDSLFVQIIDDKMPTAIALDSCTGYLYWSSTNLRQYTIERAQLQESDIEVLVYVDGACLSLAIDQETKKIYWGEDRNDNIYSIESADFNGSNRKTLVVDTYNKPTALSVAKDGIYWVSSGNNAVWKLSKYPGEGEKPIRYMKLSDDAIPFGIAAYYPVNEQISDLDECEPLTILSQNSSALQNYNSNDDVDDELFCVYGTKVSGRSLCECISGYTGFRCDVSVCYNYCLHGHCFFEDGEPKCSCSPGFKGERCEVDMCEGYCLNYGSCIPLEWGQPVCLCMEGYDGSRCEDSSRPVETDLGPLCTCNSKLNYDMIDNFKSVIRKILQGVSVIFDRKHLVMGLCVVCGMFLGMVFAYRIQLRSNARYNNMDNMATHRLTSIPMPMDWANQEKIQINNYKMSNKKELLL